MKSLKNDDVARVIRKLFQLNKINNSIRMHQIMCTAVLEKQ